MYMHGEEAHHVHAWGGGTSCTCMRGGTSCTCMGRRHIMYMHGEEAHHVHAWRGTSCNLMLV